MDGADQRPLCLHASRLCRRNCRNPRACLICPTLAPRSAFAIGTGSDNRRASALRTFCVISPPTLGAVSAGCLDLPGRERQHIVGHFVAATACALEFVLLRVGCFRSLRPAIHFRAKLSLTRFHAFVAHRLVFGGVRLDLRASRATCPASPARLFSQASAPAKNSLPRGGR
jgi:hypothetical protein